MRILDHKLMLLSTFLIIFMLALCLANLIIYVRYRRNLFTVCFHISSIFAMISLFCVIIDLAIIDLPLEKVYRTVSVVSFGFFVMSSLISAAVLVGNKDQGITLLKFSSDCKSIFSEAADLELIADYKGLIIDVNHPEKLDEICPRASTLKEVFSQLEGYSIGAAQIPEFPSDIRYSMRYEIYLNQRDTYYMMSVLPMLSGGMRMGFTVLFQDVSAIKQSERLLNEQNLELEEANRKLSHYVTVASALEAEKEKTSNI